MHLSYTFILSLFLSVFFIISLAPASTPSLSLSLTHFFSRLRAHALSLSRARAPSLPPTFSLSHSIYNLSLRV